MTRISSLLRRRIIERAQGFCEYCYAHQRYIIVMEIDFIRPEAVGGTIDEDNLCLACTSCHDNKYGLDPFNQDHQPLFNPRTQRWHEHFEWVDDCALIFGRTAIGRATVERLEMNRWLVVATRHDWRKIGWQPPAK